MAKSRRHQIAGRIGANVSWSLTDDRSARTQPARSAFLARFEDQVDPDRKLDPQERAICAEHAMKAHVQRLALKSAKVRRKA